MKKYVFFDIDGTLLPEGETNIPQKTLDAIEKLKNNNIIPMIATGRCYHQAEKYINQINSDNYIVSNGQEVFLNSKNIYEYNFDEIKRKEIIELLKKTNINWGFETRERIYIISNENSEIVKKTIEGYGIQDIKITKESEGHKIKQFWIFGSKEDVDKTIQNFSKVKDIKMFRWNAGSVEIVPKQESKGHAIKMIEKNLNYSIKTYAFGDGLNDIEMLETVDEGVAMENGYDEVKQVSSYITSRCDDNGIEKGLKYFDLI